MSKINQFLNRLKGVGVLSLSDLRQLSLDERDELFEEIKKWCLYADGNLEKLTNTSGKEF